MTLASQEDAFLAAIREHPQDDTPRLIFADWLAEHDNGKNGYAARAEFTCVQCQLAGETITRSRREALKRREQELLAAHREEWMQPLCAVLPVLRDWDWDVTFVRGFPSVTLRRVQDLQHAASLASIAPEVHLDLSGNRIGDEGAQELAHSPYLQHVTRLSLHNNVIGDADARALAASRYLQRLTALDLSDNFIRDEGGRALLQSLRSGPLRNVTELFLHGNGIGDAVLSEIQREMERRQG
jgi:uncharacterized protein (TIGR02996 family)